MPTISFDGLVIVAAAALAAPLALALFPRIRLPAIVLEIVLGIVIGPRRGRVSEPLPELLDAKALGAELGVTRAAAEAIMRRLPVVQIEVEEGLRAPV